MSIFQSLDYRWTYLTIHRRPWRSRTIERGYSTTVLSRGGGIRCYDLFIFLLFLTCINIRNNIIYPDKQLIICLESLELCLCCFSHSCWCLILCLCLVLLCVLFLLCKPLRLFFLIRLKCVAFAKLLLFLSIATRCWVFPLLCETIELVISEIDWFDLSLIIIWILDIEQIPCILLLLINNLTKLLCWVLVNNLLPKRYMRMCGHIHGIHSRRNSVISLRCLDSLWNIDDFDVILSKLANRLGIASALGTLSYNVLYYCLSLWKIWISW